MDEKTDVRIEQYLQGELSAENRAEFELAMAQDSELAAEVALQQDIEAALGESEVADLEQKLRRMMEKKSSASIISFKGWQKWGVAASVVLILGIGYLLVRNLSQPRTPEELYLAYAELPTDLKLHAAMRSGQEGQESDSLVRVWLVVDSLYQAEFYDQALAKLETWSAQHPEPTPGQTSTYHYCRGMIQLQTEEFAEAQISLEQVRSGPSAERAHWYRTLIQLRQEGATEAVRKQLQYFAGYDKNPFQNLAKALLDELE